VEIAGNTDLVTGSNTLLVTVTAANGNTRDYTVTLKVAKNNDASLGIFTVNDIDAFDGYTLEVDNGTTSVQIIAEASDPGATVEILGNENLQTGTNSINVKVTAANGTTVVYYGITVTVAAAPGENFSNDTSLSTFKVDGATVVDGQTVNISQGRNSVSVEAVPTDIYATALTAGNTGLKAGENDVTATVTADDGTVKVYHINVVVATPSSDATISSFKVNGSVFYGNPVSDGVYDAPFGTSQVTVVATPNNSAATVTITGDTGLHAGANVVSIHVVAENGTSADYSFKVVVAAANTNTDLKTFKVNGKSVIDAEVIELAYGTTGV
jgi:hypothetical protein